MLLAEEGVLSTQILPLVQIDTGLDFPEVLETGTTG
jgi:hypothetical protein